MGDFKNHRLYQSAIVLGFVVVLSLQISTTAPSTLAAQFRRRRRHSLSCSVSCSQTRGFFLLIIQSLFSMAG